MSQSETMSLADHRIASHGTAQFRRTLARAQALAQRFLRRSTRSSVQVMPASAIAVPLAESFSLADKHGAARAIRSQC